MWVGCCGCSFRPASVPASVLTLEFVPASAFVHPPICIFLDALDVDVRMTTDASTSVDNLETLSNRQAMPILDPTIFFIFFLLSSRWLTDLKMGNARQAKGDQFLDRPNRLKSLELQAGLRAKPDPQTI